MPIGTPVAAALRINVPLMVLVVSTSAALVSLALVYDIVVVRICAAWTWLETPLFVAHCAGTVVVAVVVTVAQGPVQPFGLQSAVFVGQAAQASLFVQLLLGHELGHEPVKVPQGAVHVDD